MRTLVLLLALLAPASAFAEKTRVLVTGFDPFAGRPVNNSWRIANELQNHVGEDIEIVPCLLPVVYDEGADAAQKCLDAMEPKPDLVISMGEGGCNIRLETAAHNLDDSPGFPDNAGRIRENRPILADHGKSIGFDLPVQEMYCSLTPEQRERVSVSETPGGFVCNNTAFHLAAALKGSGTQFGFVHVPASDCSEDTSDPKVNAAVIGGMIRRVVDYRATEVAPTHAMPHCSNDVRLPTDGATIDGLLGTIDEASGRDCEREFLERLKERL